MTVASPHLLAALVTPWLFYAGLGAVSVPLLIHLLTRRRFKRVRWAAIDFLLQAQRENRRRMRLRELILLALRCLAMLLIGLLLARPFLAPSGLASMIGGRERTQHLFVLDDSFSMTYSQGKDGSFTSAVEAVRRTVRGLADSTGGGAGDPVVVLRASRPRSDPLAVPSLSAANVPSLMEQLEALRPSHGRAQWDEALDVAAAMLAEAGRAVNAVVYLVSDFQQPDWTAAEPRARFADLRNLAEGGKSLRLALIDVGVERVRNLTLSGLRTDQRQVVTGLAVRLTAEVTNHGSAASEPAELAVFLDETALAAGGAIPVPAIPPGGSVAVPLEVAFAEPGLHTVHAVLSADALEEDNHRYLAVEALPAVRTLLINGEPAGDPYEDEVHLLATALRPEGVVFSGIEVTVIEDHELENADLDAADLVALCNVYRPSPTAADKLERYVSAGGGLVIFVGDQVDGRHYNELLFRDGAGLLPASLGEPVSVPADRPGVGFAPPEWDHPVLRLFAGAENPLARGIHIWRYLALAPALPPDDRSGQDEQEHPGPTTRESDSPPPGPARVVLRLADETGLPAWVERSYGRGRVVLLAVPCDNEWGDWPASPSYVVTMVELAQYVCRQGAWQQSVTVGSPLVWPHQADREEPRAAVRTPAYPVEAEATVSARGVGGDAAGGSGFIWERTELPGVYRLAVALRAGGSRWMAAAVNADPQEADLTHVGRDRLQALVEDSFGGPAEYLLTVEESTGHTRPMGRELWAQLLVLAVALLMVEQFLGWFFGRGG